MPPRVGLPRRRGGRAVLCAVFRCAERVLHADLADAAGTEEEQPQAASTANSPAAGVPAEGASANAIRADSPRTYRARRAGTEKANRPRRGFDRRKDVNPTVDKNI